MLQTKTTYMFIRLLAIFLLLSVFIVGCSKDEVEEQPNLAINFGMEPTDVVATYKGGEVTAKEFGKYLDFFSFYYYPQNEVVQDQSKWNDYLKMYVGQQLILERAKEKNLTVDAEEWNQLYTTTKEGVTSALENGLTYDQFLAQLNLSEQDIKDQLGDMLLFSEYFYTLKSDKELKQYYDANPEYFMIASVRHILIDNQKRSDEEAKELATELANRIRAGEDFATLANEYTDDEYGNLDNSNNKKGGLYEDQPVTQWVEPFKVATMTLPLHQVSDPVQTEYGYHVMRVESRETLPFEQVKDQIAANEGQAAYNTFLNEELEALPIESKLPEAKKE